MERLDNVPLATHKTALRLKFLVVMMASTMTASLSHADVEKKQIGDLEIYKAAEGGKVTITLMLDTSGSMNIYQVDYACDLPANTDYVRGNEPSVTNPSYTRNYCEIGGEATEKRYFYLAKQQKKKVKWSACDSSGSTNRNHCNGKPLNSAPSVDGYLSETAGDNTYYYKNVKVGSGNGKVRVYDRITRLKDAIFELMDDTELDSSKVAIGIGQYSTQSNSQNQSYSNGDGKSGKILVPAALISPIQRQAIKVAVANLSGRNGTPTANAYAEAGAYMLGTNTSGSTYSGISNSITTSKSTATGPYISPLSNSNSATCDGRGIYFLTDGNPNSSPDPVPLMKLALGSKGGSFSIPSDTLPNGSENNNGMPAVGAFAKALRIPAQNPLGANILTAVVGFGSLFDVDRVADAAKPNENDRVIRRLSYIDANGSQKTSEFYNCAKISDRDAKNACNWGAKSHTLLPNVGGFGEGGFYSAQSTDDIVNSITTFVSELNQTLPSTPSGTIIIPDDPYRADSQLAFAYYPTLQPRVADNAVIWEGNMKKYSLNEGTLYGKNKAKLFKNVAGELNKTTPDLWSDKDYLNANDKVESGGFYAQLKTPDTGLSTVRTLYVEDWESASIKLPKLRKIGVNSAGKFTLDDTPLSNTNKFNDSTTYSEETLIKLLSFLGFDDVDTSTNVEDMTLSSDDISGPIKVIGATIHSTPASVSYSATLDVDGKVTDQRDDYVLFGSTEGGLHLVNADNYSNTGDGGKEKFVIIPKEMLKTASKSDALVKGETKNDIGSPNFGIDAPWLVVADYKYDFANKRVGIDTTNGKGLYAYGGLRMGGEAFYGLNLIDNNNPSMMFAITPSTAGFSRMGQIWSEPTKAKIKTSNTDTGTDVLVFGGGYDMCYENEGFQVGVTNSALGVCSNKTSVKGNAVYIVNANTGALIWSASNVANSTGISNTVSTMTNSVVAGVTTLDRNNDGFMDHIYFADLGGQLFRADFTNAGSIKPVTTGTPSPETSFTNTRVTQVLQSAYTGNDTKYNYRFYERPVVSFYRNPNSNTLFALVNAISGDRSSPLSKIRDNTKSDRLYGIMDSDVTKPDNIFYASNFTTAGTPNGQTIANLTANNTTSSNLAELPSTIGTLTGTGYTLAQKNTAITTLQGTTKKGWYYPLTRFDGFGNVRYTKGVGKSQVIDSFLYTTVYNPDMNYGTVDSCSAKITGGSERQLYCLPYGICTDDAAKDGSGGFVRAGKGIQELTLGPRSSTLTNQRLLIGTRTLTERANDRVNFGSDTDKGTYNALNKPEGLNQSLGNADLIIGSGSAPDLIFNDRFTLQPKTWYEVD
ncbi:pilus assembly protein PilY [Psychrobacter sp. SMN/5/1215-MNA-CIBAN-0208]|uniref:pilus assembly protein PilY n=1 Tax=Psychrobacter sp. SMN/5/1215-MNA-CIBAN-0208 TaxID=3140442 RepID=UPI00332908A0